MCILFLALKPDFVQMDYVCIVRLDLDVDPTDVRKLVDDRKNPR